MRRALIARSPESSLESIYRRHAADIYRYVLALLGSPSDAEEVTQTTFLNAYRAIERGEHPRNPSAWLHSIALNLCRQRFRQAARRPAEVPLSGHEIAELVPDDESPTLEDLTRALGHLPFNQRAALVMREFEGRSPGQIADALDLSVSAVETLLFRARRGLREQLEGGLTCQQAERAISLQLDGLLPRKERGSLRAHLRECDECAQLARRLRGQRGAMKSLSLVPFPSSLLAAGSPAGTVAGAGAGAGVGAGTVAGAGAGVGAGAPIAGSLVAKVAAGALATAAVAAGGYAVVAPRPSSPTPARHVQHAGRTEATSRTARAAATAPLGPGSLAHRTEQIGTQRQPSRHHRGKLRARGPGRGVASSTLAAAPTQSGAPGTPVAQVPSRHGRQALGSIKTPGAKEPRVTSQEARVPKIRNATAATPKTKAPKAGNPKGKVPVTKVPKGKGPATKVPTTDAPKSKTPKEKAPNAPPKQMERQSTKPSRG